MLEIGKERYRGIEVVDDRGDVLLTVEMLANGNVFLEARLYNRQGHLVASIDPDGYHEHGGAQVILRGGPPS